MNALQLLKDTGFKPVSNLNYCTQNGIEYFIGYRKKEAAITAIIHDESIYFITKDELREMAETAKVKGIEKLHLFTNYGLELHSQYDNPAVVGFTSIKKIVKEWN